MEPGQPGPDLTPDLPDGIGRRDLLRLAAVGVGTMGLPSVLGSAEAMRVPGALERPYSMAMHIHASLSEGRGSMESHLQQATRIGADVVWWTDHDFRMTGHSYRTAVRFDGPTEREGGLAWTWQPSVLGNPVTATHQFVDTPRSPDEAGGSLRLLAVAGQSGAWAGRELKGVAWNSTYSTSYGDTLVDLDVRRTALGPDAELVVRIESSYRPASHGRPAGPYTLEYRIGARRGRWTEQSGRTGVVGIRAGAPRTWQRIRLNLGADHAAIWPDLVRGDASLWRLWIGIRARSGARAEAHVDRLRFHRTQRSPEELLAYRRAMRNAYANRFPQVRSYLAAEISLVNHMNVFGGDGTLPRYPAGRRWKDSSVSEQKEMVKFLKSHGGTVALNHPLAGGSSHALAEKLIRHRGMGAHAIEIGSGQDIGGLADVFDVIARNALFLTGTGVTDDHNGTDWLAPGRPRWLTSVWARSKSADDLCAGVRAGRVWFNDPLRWKGHLDLLAQGRAPMGGVIFTDRTEVPVDVVATGVPTGWTVRVVVGRCDRPGLSDLTPRRRSEVWPASSINAGHRTIKVLRGGSGAYVRTQVHDRSGNIVGFSNPVWMLASRLRNQVAVPPARHYPA